MLPSRSMSIAAGVVTGLAITLSPWSPTRPAAQLGGQIGQRRALSGGDRQAGPLTPEQEAMFEHLEVIDVPDGQGGLVKTLRISGANLQVTNGLGATNGYPADPTQTNVSLVTSNGLGNVILGYAEAQPGQLHTGSHNLVAGFHNQWRSVGGLLVSSDSYLSGVHASISGGWRHVNTSLWASVAGGQDADLRRPLTVQTGGVDPLVNGNYAVVAGGHLHHVRSSWGTILGGYDGDVSDLHGTIVGGQSSWAAGTESTVVGGFECKALGNNATAAGGSNGQAWGTNALVMGGLRPYADGTNAVVVGGQDCRASGTESTVHGGFESHASGNNATVIGGNRNLASGTNSVVAGGRNNITSGLNSAISGGEGRNADESYEWYGGAHHEN